MPVEIRELIIRATTNLSPSNNAGQGQVGASDKNAQVDQEAIIQEAVKQVLRILEKSKER